MATKQKDTILKYELKFEDEISIDIWKFDKTKSKFGPVEVIITYKNEMNAKRPIKR